MEERKPAKDELAKPEPDKMVEFRKIMTEIVIDALNINNDKLANQINYGVSDIVTREIGCMLARKEEVDEERFKRVDRMLKEVVSIN